jgi:hypothetical protein
LYFQGIEEYVLHALKRPTLQALLISASISGRFISMVMILLLEVILSSPYKLGFGQPEWNKLRSPESPA